MGIRGYKVFQADWTCLGKQYSCPGRFREEILPEAHRGGMYFCRRATDCIQYYRSDPENHIAEIVAHGSVLEDGDRMCTDDLEVVREIPWEEVLGILNMGRMCTGILNSGDYNSGDWNSGGHNSGHCNSGGHNSGHWNSGDWNSCSHSSGCFNTEEHEIHLFNRPSGWTYTDWFLSRAREVMMSMPGERAGYPARGRTADGSLEKTGDLRIRQKWWEGLDDSEKSAVMGIPNFDAGIFREITGIDVEARQEGTDGKYGMAVPGDGAARNGGNA